MKNGSVTAEGLCGRPLPQGKIPQRIVVIRLHAFGDAVITLPLLAGLRQAYPEARVDVVTSSEYADLFTATELTTRVWSLQTSGSRAARIAATISLASKIGPADLVVDLQRSTQSGLLRRLMRPDYWVAFDRFAPRLAMQRYHDAFGWVGLGGVSPLTTIPLQPGLHRRARALLGDPRSPLVCLNPAGCWPTKQWPIERYIELGRRLIERSGARIVLLGTENVASGAAEIDAALGDHVINLVGRTSTAEALAVVQELSLMISDDSGLMHLAWTSGVPTIALMGATRSVWSAPVGDHTFCYASEDLPCGACMQPICARGDLLCLERVGVEQVLRQIDAMI